MDVISFASLQNSSIEYLAYMVPVLEVSIVVQTSNEMDVQQVILMFQSFKALCSLPRRFDNETLLSAFRIFLYVALPYVAQWGEP